MAKEDVVIGFVAGAAVAVLAPLAVLLAVGSYRRPLSRALTRGGRVLAEKTRETFAEIQEITEDFVVEMRAPAGGAAAAAAPTGRAAEDQPPVAAAAGASAAAGETDEPAGT